MYCWYLRNTYLDNALRQPGALTVCGEKLDLSAIKARKDLRTSLIWMMGGAVFSMVDSAQKCMRSSAIRYSLRHTKWFMPITNTHITQMPSAMRWKSPAAVMWAM